MVEAWEVTGSDHSGLSIKEDKTISAVEEMSLAKEKRKSTMRRPSKRVFMHRML